MNKSWHLYQDTSGIRYGILNANPTNCAMHIADNIIRHHLRNMYFLAGTACGGKTTMSRALAEKHGLPLYRELMNREEHQQYIASEYQPGLAQQFEDWNAYFNRPPAEYAAWLRGTLADDFPMVVMDLIAHNFGQPLVVDYHVLPEFARGRIGMSSRATIPRLLRTHWRSSSGILGYRSQGEVFRPGPSR